MPGRVAQQELPQPSNRTHARAPDTSGALRVGRCSRDVTSGRSTARQRGGNAIVAMRLDRTEFGDAWTEICAYGTAVQAVPVTDAAKYTAQQLGYGAGG